MFLGRRAKRQWIALQGFQAQMPERFGIVLIEDTSLYRHLGPV
jgi:hypothetical protein